MKDKLVRTGHKKGYYFFKRCAVGASIVLASSILIALPLSYGVNKVQQSESIELKVETNTQEIK